MDQFFSSYGAILQQVATFCQQEGMDAMYIASNLVYMEPFVAKWTSLINTLRGIFGGTIIYRTNWWWNDTDRDAKLTNNLFSLVDIIAIAAYFEVSNVAVPTTQQIIDGLYSSTVYGRGQNIYQEIKTLSQTFNKPIYFGELGICPNETAASQP